MLDMLACCTRVPVTIDLFYLKKGPIPSKTTDIEQSLVIGAHGPKSLLVIVLRK